MRALSTTALGFSALIWLAAMPGLHADGTTTVLPAGQQAQPWLTLSTDPRASAMGGAVVAASGDVQALHNNPAGLNQLFDPQLALTDNEVDTSLGMREEYLAWGHRLGEGGFAASVNYFSYGSFDNRDANGAQLDSTTDQAYAGTIGWGTGFLDDRLSVGMSLLGSQEVLGSSVTSLYSAGLGGLYDLMPGLSLGASLSNIGLSVQGGQAPSEIDIGGAWQLFKRSLTVAAQYNRPGLGESSEGVGVEWRVLGDYSLRAGWRFASGNSTELDQGFTAGAGAKLGPVEINYAYVPYGDLTPVHRFGLTMDLSEGLFGGNIVIAGVGVTQNAQAEYEDGQAAYTKGDWYEAKVSLDRALKIFPQFDKADEIKSLLRNIDQKIMADKSRPMTKELKEKIQQRMEAAKQFMDNGELSKARAEAQAVLEYDSSLKDAVALLSTIAARITAKVGGLKQEAVNALSANDIQTAVLKYRAVLRVDDSDAESVAVLLKMAPRIRQEVKSLHRKGIDLYVSSDIAGAMRLWERALELDPSDPNFIRRDMDKAKKLLELRSN
jgi:tetratricopeptide (TPR) repeat protein